MHTKKGIAKHQLVCKCHFSPGLFHQTHPICSTCTACICVDFHDVVKVGVQVGVTFSFGWCCWARCRWWHACTVLTDDLLRREASSSPSRSRSRGTTGSEREQVSSLFEFCKSSMTTSESDSEEESFHSPLWWSWLSIACTKCYKNIILPSRKLLCWSR